MKIYIFHGPGETAKRDKILQIKKGFDPLSISQWSGKEFGFSDIRPSLISGSLFAETRLVILDDFTDVDLLGINDDSLTLVLNFSKTLPSSTHLFKALPQGVIVSQFDEAGETSIFPLLDALSEKNPKALQILDKYLDEWGGQYVLTMIAYNLRRFIQKKNTNAFVSKKIEQQKKNFPQERIKMLYLRVIETDFKIKQGLIEERVGLILLAHSFLH